MLNVDHKAAGWPKALKITFIASGCAFLLAGLYLLNGWAMRYERHVILVLREPRPRGDYTPLPPAPPAFVSGSMDLASNVWARSLGEGLPVLIIMGAIVATLRGGLNLRTLLRATAYGLVALLLIYTFTFTQISGAWDRPADATVPWDPSTQEQISSSDPRGDQRQSVLLYGTACTGLVTAASGFYASVRARGGR
jgi:hypothetical protein